jgi:hypothetical protein
MTRLNRRGFVFLEAVIVLLFLLAMLGLGIVLVTRLCVGPVPWYWWAIGAAALPALAVSLHIVNVLRTDWRK